MKYFQPYPLHVGDTVTTAWKSQIAQATKTPSLAELLAQRGNELFPTLAISSAAPAAEYGTGTPPPRISR